ncbi:hypothetical protein MY9_2810 [Bacillus sp. JS]|uniref:Uncharacterized protein n=1 Tax=Bacillus subtilis TaxID=1423 RepID=A0A0D1JKX8_BACIU|nr:hypothetical protein MY9_2810 [Bacillus sp. JS]KIU13174.1 hypothetical protein SC09_Contig17orf00354 [Bacillus subtilis]
MASSLKKRPVFVRRLFLPGETFHFLCLFTGVDTLEQNKCLKGI